jgi:Tfp pilus assembly protein PilX
MKNTVLYIPLLLAILAVAVFARVFTYRMSFNQLVRRSKQTSVDYDRKLIDVVNRLEKELAERASFGYTGGKDPMTGTTRRVVKPTPVKRARAKAKTTKDTAATPKEKPDPVRLTAIIFDDERGKHTAVIMDGERSLSVEQGDIVHGRRVTRITDKALYMESSSARYRYDVFGKRDRRPNRRVELPSYLDIPIGK